MFHRLSCILPSTIYGGWRILIIRWKCFLLVDAFWRMINAKRLWEYWIKMEKTRWRSSSTSFRLIGVLVTSVRLTTRATSVMHCHQFNIYGWLIGGSVRSFFHFVHIRGSCIFILRYFVYCGLCWEGMPMTLGFCRKVMWQPINNLYIGELEEVGWVLFRLHSSVYDCTEARKKISELEVDLHCKHFLSTVHLQL